MNFYDMALLYSFNWKVYIALNNVDGAITFLFVLLLHSMFHEPTGNCLTLYCHLKGQCHEKSVQTEIVGRGEEGCKYQELEGIGSSQAQAQHEFCFTSMGAIYKYL